MNTLELPTTSSATVSQHAAVAGSLELLQARQARDGLATLLRAERTAAAEFLLALSAFDHCRGWEPLGHASLFAFLHVELKLSKGGAFFRQTAARLLQRFPEIIEPLRDGRLCTTTVVELAKVLTEANRAEVLPRFYGCSSQEAKEVVAALMPMASPPIRAMVTAPAVPKANVQARTTELAVEPAAEPGTAPLMLAPSNANLAAVQSTEPLLNRPARYGERRDQVEPLTADLRRLHITVDAQFLKMLDAARSGLSHSIPSASLEQVLKAGLELLLEKLARARGQVKRPQKARSLAPATTLATAPSAPTPTSTTPADLPPPPTATPDITEPQHRRTGPSTNVAAAVRRAVWERDQARCTWPLDRGGTCGSTHRLEIDHIDPWARGGGE